MQQTFVLQTKKKWKGCPKHLNTFTFTFVCLWVHDFAWFLHAFAWFHGFHLLWVALPLVGGFLQSPVALYTCGWLLTVACGFCVLLLTCWWLRKIVGGLVQGGFVHLQGEFHLLLSAIDLFCSLLSILNLRKA